MENRKIKILAIDDIRDNLISLEALLNEFFPKAKIFTTLSGPIGLEIAATENPDVILLDIVMPVMDGYEVCRKLKSNEVTTEIPVVFVTAIKDDKESRIRALEAGGDAFLSKPIDESELVAQIRAMVKIKEANEEKKNEKLRLERLISERTNELMNELQERKKAEEKVRRASENWNKTFDAMHDGIALLDADMCIVQSNKIFREFVQRSEDELKNKHCFHFIHNTECPIEDCPFLRMRKSKKRERMELTVKESIIEVMVDPIMDEKGTILGAVHIVSDITERKTIEKELVIAKNKAEESDRLKSAFLANMSHEIRTPMNGILGFIELLQNPSVTDEQHQLYVDIIKTSGERLMNTINDIIEISKIEAKQSHVNYSEVEIGSLMNYLYSFFKIEAEQKGLQFLMTNVLTNSDSLVLTDKNKLTSIFLNLIKNALKFTNEGFIEFGNNFENGEFSFYVKDSGMGIPADKLGIIFDRFVQADLAITRPYEGSGLGLSISKAYVEMLGGKIEIDSELGKGTTIRFTINYNPVKQMAQHAIPNNSSSEITKKENVILIAEDDDASFSYLSILLSKTDFIIERARNGKEALDMCKTNPNIVMVLMDLKMPKMDGYEATRQIRLFNQQIPIIAQTAFALIGDREKALESGCTEYISKPVKRDDLFGLINKFYELSGREN